ncbi:hypothetical protein [Paenibacillus sp. FSL M7-0896]|uniref:hypothetical protein n=1 Tax=Paenibacillus sp. FSL M7-0896 TaxID=2921610 RepID=UPI0030DB8390
MNIRFVTTDPAVHYLLASYFSETGRLLLRVNNLIAYEGLSSYPFLAYSNTGLLMSFVESSVSKIAIYLISNILIYFFLILTLFSIYSKFVKKVDFLQTTIIIIIAAAGYNFNSIIFGFTSQMAGVLLVLTIILINESIENKKVKILLLTLNMVGLFFAYYYFIPAAMIAFVLSDLIDQRNFNYKSIMKNILSMQNIIVCGVTFICGVSYLLIFNNKELSSDISAIASEGYIYRDLYSNFKPYLIFAVLSFSLWIREKRTSSIFIFTLIYVLLTLGLLYMGMRGEVSSYYYFKNYYLLENLFILLFVIGLNYTKIRFRALYFSIVSIICILGLTSVFLDKPIQQKNLLFNVELERNVTKIQNFNKETAINMTTIFNEKQRGFMDRIVKNKTVYLEGSNYIPVVGDLLQQLWFYSYTEIWPKYNSNALSSFYEDPILDYKKWKNDLNKNPYLILFDSMSSEEWSKKENIDLNDFDVIVKVEGAVLLRLKEASISNNME